MRSNKGRTVTPQEREAGKRNLAAFNAEHPEHGNYKHGAMSINRRRRFSDRRTTDGKRLALILDAIVQDLGGPKDLSAAQRVLLDTSIRPKLITLHCIGQYLDRQENIIDGDGSLIKCLGQNYLAFSNSLRLDLTALYVLATGKPSKVPTVEEIMRRVDEVKER